MSGRALWDSGYTLHVEVAFSAATGDSGVWDVSLWDTGTWGPDRVWSDVTLDTFLWSSNLGRNREDGHCTAATGGVTLDSTSGAYTPENLSGVYVTGGVTGVRPGRPIRGYAVRDSDQVEFPLFYGSIDDWDENLDSRAPTITFAWVDGIADLAGTDGYEQPDAGAGELVGRRMHRILDNAEWDSSRNIDIGTTALQGTTLAQAAWTEVLLSADSAGGDAWVEPDNTFRFADREAPLRNTRSNSVQWTFTDADTPGALRYESLALRNGMDMLVTQVALARAGGTVIVDTDLAARALYGRTVRRWGRNDLICQSDIDVETLVKLALLRRADPSRRPREIVLRPQIYPELWPVVLGAKRWDRVQVVKRHATAGTTITHDCFVDGIGHAADSTDWVTVIRLASTVGYPTVGTFGVWDSSVWDGAVWAPEI